MFMTLLILTVVLKNIVCAKNVVPCEQCKLRKECIYAKMF